MKPQVQFDIQKREDKIPQPYTVWRPVGECIAPDGRCAGPVFATRISAGRAARALSAEIRTSDDCPRCAEAPTLRLVITEVGDEIHVHSGYHAGAPILEKQLEAIAKKIGKRGV